MFKRYYRMTLFMVSIGIVLAGCAKPPTEEMIKAEKSIDEARHKEADIFANDILARAVESFETAKMSVAKRKYDKARQIALDTIQIAEQAAAIAPINKEQIVNEIGNGIHDINVTIDELKKIEAKSFTKKPPIKYDELQEMIKHLDEEQSGIKNRLNNNEVMAARDDLETLAAKVEEVKEKASASLKTKKKQR